MMQLLILKIINRLFAKYLQRILTKGIVRQSWRASG